MPPRCDVGARGTATEAGGERELLTAADLSRAIVRIAHQITETTELEPARAEELVLLGIPTRGVHLARRLAAHVAEFTGTAVRTGTLDPTLYRDDLRRHPTPALEPTMLPPGGVDDRLVVLVDDVLYSGRTVRAASTRCVTAAAPAPCSSPCSSTGATGSCRSGPITSARTCRPRGPRRSPS